MVGTTEDSISMNSLNSQNTPRQCCYDFFLDEDPETKYCHLRVVTMRRSQGST